MNLQLDASLSTQYKSASQKARVVTEGWAEGNLYCPVCGHSFLSRHPNNKPVADFFCKSCEEDYELKSKEIMAETVVSSTKIVNGAYCTMIERITSQTNPDLLFLTHKMSLITNLLLVPRFFFTPAIIEKRKPLATSARRAGWTGCNICLNDVPNVGKIELVKDSVPVDKASVIARYRRSSQFQTDNMSSRSWLMDVYLCIEKLPNTFSLIDVYGLESYLLKRHPSNNNVHPKIRQQLQCLRDKGVIEFIRRGEYRRV